jgi:hypothetical protein
MRRRDGRQRCHRTCEVLSSNVSARRSHSFAAAQRRQCTLVASPQLPSYDDRQPQGKEPNIALFSASAPLHHSLSSADFITNIAESSFRHTHPIDSSIDTHQIQSMRRSSVRQERCAHTTKNRTEVLCPRVTQAAMIAAASFGLRRSGTFATATSGAAYWAASVRHGPPWPLPVNAPKSIFQNSILYRAANSVGSPPS